MDDGAGSEVSRQLIHKALDDELLSLLNHLFIFIAAGGKGLRAGARQQPRQPQWGSSQLVLRVSGDLGQGMIHANCTCMRKHMCTWHEQECSSVPSGYAGFMELAVVKSPVCHWNEVNRWDAIAAGRERAEGDEDQSMALKPPGSSAGHALKVCGSAAVACVRNLVAAA